MMQVTIHPIDQTLLPAFAPYLFLQAARLLREERPGFFAVGAIWEGAHSCGAACAVKGEEGHTLISLFVDPTVRRKGIATALLAELTRLAGPLQAAQWILPESELVGLKGFLRTVGFDSFTQEGEPILRLSSQEMRQVPVVRRAFSPSFRPDHNVIPISSLTEEERAAIEADESIPPVLRLSAFAPERLRSPLSLAYRYGGEIVAYFLAEPTNDGAAVLAAVTRPKAHAAAFLQLATAAIHRSLPYLPEGDGYYWVDAVNEASATLCRQLSGGLCKPWRRGWALWSPPSD